MTPPDNLCSTGPDKYANIKSLEFETCFWRVKTLQFVLGCLTIPEAIHLVTWHSTLDKKSLYIYMYVRQQRQDKAIQAGKHDLAVEVFVLVFKMEGFINI